MVVGLPELECPVCSGNVEVPDDAIVGEVFEHEECGAQLELYEEDGQLKLRVLEDVREDWGE